MIRLGLLVVASIATYAVRQSKGKTPRAQSSLAEPPENGEASLQQKQDETEDNSPEVEHGKNEEEEEKEEEEEVKTINSELNQASKEHPSLDYEDMFPEFENLLSGEIEFPLPNDKYDLKSVSEVEKEKAYEIEMKNKAYKIEMEKNANELDRLRNLVKELEEREVKLEGELLEYYGLKEQESDVVELQKQLKIKTVEIDMMNITINTLQAERKKLQEEIAQGAQTRKDLEIARNKIKELQRQIQLDANQTKGQLLMLKQQVTGLQTKEEQAFKMDSEVEKKLKAAKDLEVEVVELKRKNKELQHEKRELAIKLDAAESKVTALSNMTESDMVAQARQEVTNLRYANEDLQKQVEGLQMNRFSEVEELVYLRWVNACLRFELRNYQTPAGKTSARDLSKSLSPRSQEKAKRMMLEMAGSERGGDTDLESASSLPSSPGSEDFDNMSIDSSTSRYSNFSKKPSLIQKLKKWGKSKDDSSVLSSPARSFGGNSPSRASMSVRSTSIPRGPLEVLMLRNAGDSVAITTFGQKEQELNGSPETPNLPRIRTTASTDNLNNVAASFQLMSKSVEGVHDEKYPAYKDRHKLALEREKDIKEKAEKARANRFGDGLNSTSMGQQLPTLPPKLTQIKKKVVVNTNTDSDQQSDENMSTDTNVVTKMKLAEIEKRAPRVPRPPPKPTGGAPAAAGTTTVPAGGILPPPPRPPGAPPPPPRPPGAPPPPPPPPGSLQKGSGTGDKVHRAPELVEFYQTLMKREGKKDITTLSSSKSNVADVRSNMIGEIQNKSTFLLAVKADVETQGDFVQSLATEVRAATFTSIDDLVTFVNWLDEELSFLVSDINLQTLS